MNRLTTRVRVRVACGDDVKSSTIKEKENTSTVYTDFQEPKSNLDVCTNPVGVPVLGRVMHNLL